MILYVPPLMLLLGLRARNHTASLELATHSLTGKMKIIVCPLPLRMGQLCHRLIMRICTVISEVLTVFGIEGLLSMSYRIPTLKHIASYPVRRVMAQSA